MTQPPLLSLVLCLLVLAGVGSLAVASARYRQRSTPVPMAGVWRVSGWVLVALASVVAIVLQGWAMALVYLLAAATLATTSVVLVLSYRPRWLVPIVLVALPSGLLLFAGI
ncbi:MAG: DUF3325 domain-containing protein [Pseudohongiella sp.]|uniref:DUF3325 domain-containing protein n=1 Tax=Pseudohongiella sp. TaxID=1979412 RepID=UPI00349FF710